MSVWGMLGSDGLTPHALRAIALKALQVSSKKPLEGVVYRLKLVAWY
ncbi:hypothetical protein [Nostoc sp. 'Peltigera membranacea cyanobiont' 232]|nr:hypothetical protein [Nostoc sp. 'Peltigera membranacea cyanobiont' 232]